MSVFVLVHGAWHGGWAWQYVRKILERDTHQVYTPTLTGHGERAHLMSENISMDTVVDDVVTVFKTENISEAILVGHSFGGAIISGVAERVPSRIRQLVYLDAAILENGECMFDCMSPEIAAERRRMAFQSVDGISLGVPTQAQLGVTDAEQWVFLERRLTPQPLSTYETALNLQNRPGYGFPCRYIICENPKFKSLQWARARARQYGWPITAINTGHEAMVSAPEALCKILLEID